MKIMEINNEIFLLKFGLKSLFLLKEKSYINVEENPPFFFFCALFCDEQQYSFEQVVQIYNKCDQEELINNLKEILPNLLNYSKEHLRELYAKGIGEMGLSLDDFGKMTEHELDIAYEGYLHKKELEANLIQLVLKQNRMNKDEIIKITEEPQCKEGSLQEREETFSLLGLKEI